MQIVIASLAFVVALGCAGLMGFAIQRGATCTVAAVDEIVSERTCRRLLSLVEAALWVAAGLVVARSLQMLPVLAPAYPVSVWTVIGGALLGVGAFVNGACVFGAIARFGSGQWAYLMTPVGFFVGCLTVAPLYGWHEARPIADAAVTLQAPAWAALLVVAIAIARIAATWRRNDSGRALRWHAALAGRVWSPHVATTVIALAFVVLLVLAGSWAYTDVLAELARGMSAGLVGRGLLLVALLLGAVLGGWTADLFRSTRVSTSQLLRCFVGGALMGWGSLLLPGGNDGLILVAMPLGRPYAWLGFATMVVTIATALLLSSRPPPAPPARSSRRPARGTR